jgi:hypothetical protein
MLEVKKTNEGVVLSLSFQLDKEDATDLIKELQNYVAREEAREQNESKNRLQKEMQRVFVDVLDTEYLETKFATVYKLDEINREVEILRKKLNNK